MEFLTLIAQQDFVVIAGYAGILGVIVYLGAYFALQIGWIRGQSFIYPSLNLVAAALVLTSLITNFNLASAIIQISFILISLIGLVRMALGSFLVRFSDEEKHFLSSKFPSLRGQRARQFLDAGTWRNLQPGTILTQEGTPSKMVSYVASGSVDISSGEQLLYKYSSDILVGEISCLAGAPSTATAIVTKRTRVFCIGSEKLRRMVARDAELRLNVEAGFSRDIRQKIIRKNATFREFIEASTRSPLLGPSGEMPGRWSHGRHYNHAARLHS